MRPDALLYSCGSIWLLEAVSQAAKDWCEASLCDPMMFGTRYCVEARFVGDVARGMIDDGLTLGGG